MLIRLLVLEKCPVNLVNFEKKKKLIMIKNNLWLRGKNISHG